MVTVEGILSYFTDPAATGYTPEKTVIFALLLIGAVYVIYEILKRLRLKVDRRFVVGIIPYVLLGSLLRSLEDAKIFTSYWLITPGIYVVITAVFLATLAVSLLIQKKFNIAYYKILFMAGFLAFVSLLPLLQLVNLTGILLVILFYIPWPIIFYKAKWLIGNKLVMLAQMLDATVTFVAIQFFGYYEKHVFGSFLIGLFSPISFVIVKFAAIIVILKLLDKFSDDKDFTNYLKLVIGILGLATGARDFFSLAALV